METVMDHIGADGVFTTGFSAAAITGLGEGYENSKYLDDVTDISALVKRGIDTRAKNTELSEQLKTAIRRPAQDASDEDKAAFRKSLLTEAGATFNIDDYKIGRPTDAPEGLPFSQEGADAMAEMLCAAGVPLDTYKTVVETAKQNAIAGFNANQSTRKEVFDTAVKAVTDEHQPGKITELGRLAFLYVQNYGLPAGSKQAAEAISGPTGRKDDSGALVMGADGKPERKQSMYDIPSDFAEWDKRGVSPSMVMHMAGVAGRTQAGTTKPGDGSGGGGSETPEEKQQREYIAACNANSPGLQPAQA